MYEFIEFLKLLIWCWATMQKKYISITLSVYLILY